MTLSSNPPLSPNPRADAIGIADRKAELRRAAIARRAALPQGGGDRLATHLMAHLGPALPRIAAGYWPINGEMDVRPALAALAAAGVMLALPETTPRGEPLRFRAWSPGTQLIPGRFGTFHPGGEPVTPDLLLVPLLAFDRHGHRLGYGGGYYDRTLAALPAARAIGCAYAAQHVDALPHLDYDMPLREIATERGVIVIEE